MRIIDHITQKDHMTALRIIALWNLTLLAREMGLKKAKVAYDLIEVEEMMRHNHYRRIGRRVRQVGER